MNHVSENNLMDQFAGFCGIQQRDCRSRSLPSKAASEPVKQALFLELSTWISRYIVVQRGVLHRKRTSSFGRCEEPIYENECLQTGHYL